MKDLKPQRPRAKSEKTKSIEGFLMPINNPCIDPLVNTVCLEETIET